MCGAVFGVAALVTKAYAPSFARRLRNEDTSVRNAFQSGCSLAVSTRLHPVDSAIAVAKIVCSIIVVLIVLKARLISHYDYTTILEVTTEVDSVVIRYCGHYWQHPHIVLGYNVGLC